MRPARDMRVLQDVACLWQINSTFGKPLAIMQQATAENLIVLTLRQEHCDQQQQLPT